MRTISGRHTYKQYDPITEHWRAMSEKVQHDDTSSSWRQRIKNAPSGPGVYSFANAQGEVLYIGKARNLDKRLHSYAAGAALQLHIAHMLQNAAEVTWTETASESEAMLLECSWIKQELPRYNIALRDDKTYPSIALSRHHKYPRLVVGRNFKRSQYRVFGPYTRADHARMLAGELQKVFGLRICSDQDFRSRIRPCLEHEIGRCSAPCVGKASEPEYAGQVAGSVKVLEGGSDAVGESLSGKMRRASEDLDFELAAGLRDKLSALRRIQQPQAVEGAARSKKVIEIIAWLRRSDCAVFACLPLFAGVPGRPRTHFLDSPALRLTLEGEQISLGTFELLEAFIGQWYLQTGALLPDEIYLEDQEEVEIVRGIFATAACKGKGQQEAAKIPKISLVPRGRMSRLQLLTAQQVQQALLEHENRRESHRVRLEALARDLGLQSIRHLIAVDASHTQGQKGSVAVAVFTHRGYQRKLSRSYHSGPASGNDPAAIALALDTYLSKLPPAEFPDLIVIDGGQIQLGAAGKLLENITANFAKNDKRRQCRVLAVVKGEKRRPENDRVFASSGELLLASPLAMALLQVARDRAHELAGRHHRKKRDSTSGQDILASLPGLGQKRRLELLEHFGGLAAVLQASESQLCKVSGIGPALARQIIRLKAK